LSGNPGFVPIGFLLSQERRLKDLIHVSRGAIAGGSMIVAGGFVEVIGDDKVEEIVSELQRRGINIDEVEAEKILFLMERESVDLVKNELNSLRSIDEIKNVHLTYYSLEKGMGMP
jgi:nitrate reductase NapAB chaperone NapD